MLALKSKCSSKTKFDSRKVAGFEIICRILPFLHLEIKALGDRGEKGLMALDCAGRQKEVVRRVMDKKEVVKQEKEVGKQVKGCELLGKVEGMEGLQLSVRDESSEGELLEDLIETLLVDLMELVVKE